MQKNTKKIRTAMFEHIQIKSAGMQKNTHDYIQMLFRDCEFHQIANVYLYAFLYLFIYLQAAASAAEL